MLRLRDLKNQRTTELNQLDQAWVRSAYLMNVSSDLVQKHRKQLSAAIIQAHARKFLHKRHIQNEIQFVSSDILKNCLNECIQNIACEQMSFAEQENRIKIYENILDSKSKEIFDDIIKSAVNELRQEVELEQVEHEKLTVLEKAEREKQKAKLKKNRQKENKKKAKVTEKEEADLIADQIKQSKADEQVAKRNQYYQTLVQSGSISEPDLKLAMLGYDIRNLQLFDAQDNITNREQVKIFLKLFEDFLKIPFIQDVSLWSDVLAIIDKLHTKMQLNHDCLDEYIEDANRFKDLIFAKEKDIGEVRQQILKTSSRETYNKGKLLFVQVNDQLQGVVDQCNRLPVNSPLKDKFVLKIYETKEKLKKLRGELNHYEDKCRQILMIKKIRHLQDTGGPFPLFKEPLPEVDMIGYGTEDDWQDCRNYLQKELGFWLKYEEEITAYDLQQSLFRVLQKLPLDKSEIDTFGASLSSDTFDYVNRNNGSSLNFKQHCFDVLCKKHAMKKSGYDISLLADIAKIQNILIEYYRMYKQQRTK